MPHSDAQAGAPAPSIDVVTPEDRDPASPPWPVRPITEAEYGAYARVLYEAFSDSREERTAGERLHPLVEFDRTLAAFDGDTPVGTALAHSMSMTLPGGPAPVAGVSAVSVLPTHRRQGVLSALMRRQLRDVHTRGEAVAALWASEAAIYGRFGYGAAAAAADIRVDSRRAGLRADHPRDGGLRLREVTPRLVRDRLARVHRTAAAQRSGDFTRDERWWGRLLADAPEERGGMSPLTCALVEHGGEPRGYALYRARGSFTQFGLPDGAVEVEEIMAQSPAVYARLWSYLSERDLISEIHLPNRPLDDAIFGLLADVGQARATLTDNLWIRLVDLPAALEQRRYTGSVDVVMDVGDRHCEWNAGRWRLRTGATGASCAPSTDTPDVALDIAVLGAGYLGAPIGRLVEGGAVTEWRSGAATELAAALAWPRAPHCPRIF